jgi:hypothetical protein
MKKKIKKSLVLFLTTLSLVILPYFQPLNTPILTNIEFAQAKSQTVYITDTGKKYHTSSCRTLRKSKTKTTLKRAKADGYKPCKVCHPPR